MFIKIFSVCHFNFISDGYLLCNFPQFCQIFLRWEQCFAILLRWSNCQMNQMNAIVCNSFIFTLTSDGTSILTSDGDQEVGTCPAVSEPICQVNFFSFSFHTFDSCCGQISVIRKLFFLLKTYLDHITRPKSLNWNFYTALWALQYMICVSRLGI